MTLLLVVVILIPFLGLVCFFMYFCWKAVAAIWGVSILNPKMLMYCLLGPLTFLVMPAKPVTEIDERFHQFRKAFLKAVACLTGCLVYGLLLKTMGTV
jgi:hypothetical protein